jgi:uncharacterized membrane protein HdeD (DUF308 family)
LVLAIVGIALIAMGIFYLRNPSVYRHGIWMKTSIAIRLLSEASYRRYMHGLGILQIILGVGCIIWAFVG